MNDKYVSNYTTHKITLISLVIMASIITDISFNSTGFLQSAILFALILILTPILVWLFNRIYGIESLATLSSPVLLVGYTLIYLITALASLYIAADSINTFSDFSATIIIRDAPVFIIKLLLIIMSVWLAMNDPSVIYKIAVVSSLIIYVSVLVLFLLSVPHYKIEAAALFKNIDFSSILNLKSWKSITLLKMIAVIPIIIAFLSCQPKGAKVKYVYPGIIIGVLLLSLSVVQSMLIFNESYLESLVYPYLSSVSILSSDEVFLRMDGFVYIIFYACSLLKTAVCFLTVRYMFLKYSKKAGVIIPAACGIIILLYQFISKIIRQ